MSSKNNSFYQFFHIGVNKNQKEFVQKKIIIANYLASIFMFVPILFAIIAYIFFPRTLFVFAIALLIPPFTIFLNYIGLNVIARLVLSTLPTVVGMIFAAFVVQGEQNLPYGSSVILFSFGAIAFVLFDVREIIYTIFCLLFTFTNFIIFPTLDIWLDIPMDSSFIYTDLYNYITFANALIIVCVCFITLQKINLNSEKQNKTLISEANKNNQELKSKQDELNQTLEKLRKTQIENHNQTWAIKGINLINQVIQQHNDSGSLYDEIIKEVSRYLGVLQAGLYLVKKDKNKESYLALEAAFALNEQKIQTTRFLKGEGLLGETWKSKESILLENIPKNHQNINLGVAKLKVSTLFFVPIMANDEVIGAFEFYFGQKPAKHQIQFVETVSENIALMIQNLSYKTVQDKI